jgi:hypothetical protein
MANEIAKPSAGMNIWSGIQMSMGIRMSLKIFQSAPAELEDTTCGDDSFFVHPANSRNAPISTTRWGKDRVKCGGE